MLRSVKIGNPEKGIACVIAVFIIFTILTFAFAQAQQDQEAEVVTYFPSPNGSFGSLATKKLFVGGSVVDPESIGEGGIVFKPSSYGNGDGSKGQLYFDQDDHEFKYHNGNKWEALGEILGTYPGPCDRGDDMLTTGQWSSDICLDFAPAHWSR